jgi:hypothetical protein
MFGRAMRRLQESGIDISLAALREAGATETSLSNVMVIEFGNAGIAFDNLWWAAYREGGVWHPSVEGVSVLQRFFPREAKGSLATPHSQYYGPRQHAV